MEKKTGTHGVAYFLSERMLRTAAMVSRGTTVADVGCDHAYTSVYLVEQGIAAGVVAMDVNKGPLAKARENVERFQMQDKICLRLSDGLAALVPGEVDTVLIAGMGGPLMERILAAHPATLEQVSELVLQPQSEAASLRKFVQKLGFRITKEDMLKEDGKYYVMFRAERGAEASWTEYEYRYGKYLKEEAYPVLREFLSEERKTAKEVLAQLDCAGTEKAERRKEEVLLLLKQNESMEATLR